VSRHADLAVTAINYLSPAEWLGQGFGSAPMETMLENSGIGLLPKKDSSAGKDHAVAANRSLS
jgi:hypothetical protein